MNTRKSFFIETYGCQMNTAESDSLIKRLAEAGWMVSESCENASLIIINTCAVRQTAENRIWGRLGFYGKQKKSSGCRIAVMGCMAERVKDEILRKAPFVDFVIGVPERSSFIDYIASGDIVENIFGEAGESGSFEFDRIYGDPSEFKAFVPIMHGCNNFCSYCIVPYVRGPEVSRLPEDILNECEKLYHGNVKELTLLGQNVNSYQSTLDGNPLGFSGILQEIIRKTPFRWIRFMSSHPKDFTKDLISVIRDNPNICRHIHLPVQHGSNRILRLMNRKYTRENYLSLVEKIREAVPNVSLSTDLLIGFPGERESDFFDTVDLLERVRFNDAFTYYYNPREGTKAASFDEQIPTAIKKERLYRLIVRQREISLEERKKHIGINAEVLIEGLSKKRPDQVLGRTSQNEMVICSGSDDMVGTIGTVKITGISGTTLKGVWV